MILHTGWIDVTLIWTIDTAQQKEKKNYFFINPLR